LFAFSALTLLVGRQEGRLACKKLGAGVVICLEQRPLKQLCVCDFVYVINPLFV